MTTKKTIILSIFSLSVLAACDRGNGQKIAINITSDSSAHTMPALGKIDDRFSIVGDFNGDNVQDTLFESYISSITNKETPKLLNSEDYDKNVEQILSQKPLTRLYSNLGNVDTFIVTTEPYHTGVRMFSNLGDINADGADEFGYIIDWTDYSNINTFHILTLKDNKFVELFTFNIHETVNLETENLLEAVF
jgi:hypothetical protein